MKRPDQRGSKLALVPDVIVNSQSYPDVARNFPPVFPLLEKTGFGLYLLPSHTMKLPRIERWIELAVDQLQEYANRGYRTVIIGVKGLPGKGIWEKELKKEFKRRKLKPPPEFDVPLHVPPAKAANVLDELGAFLNSPTST